MKKPNLRQFRKQISTLKKQGLIPARVDARSVKPTDKAGRYKLSTLVKKFDDVLSGKLTAVKVPPTKFKEYKKNPKYDTFNNRVLVPHAATERVSVRRGNGGNISITSSDGLERVQIPVAYENLEQYLSDIAAKTKQIDKLKTRGQYWGFRFHGNNSSRLYRNIDLAIDDIQQYRSIEDAIESGNEKREAEVYRNLEFIKTSFKGWTFASENRSKQSKERNARKRKAFDENLKNKPAEVQERYRAANAERQKEYRKRLKKTAKRKYKKDARERRKRSDAKRKPKKS